MNGFVNTMFKNCCLLSINQLMQHVSHGIKVKYFWLSSNQLVLHAAGCHRDQRRVWNHQRCHL